MNAVHVADEQAEPIDTANLPHFTYGCLNRAIQALAAVLTDAPDARAQVRSAYRDLVVAKAASDGHKEQIRLAREMYATEDVEIDESPFLSVAENGLWVSAWVWVENSEEAEEEEEVG